MPQQIPGFMETRQIGEHLAEIIQNHLATDIQNRDDNKCLVASFAKLMTSDNVHAAIRLFSRERIGGFLNLRDVIEDRDAIL